MRPDPHGCRADAEFDAIQELRKRAHDERECDPRTCDYCEDERIEQAKPVCQDCGEKALPGYVAGDRCERMAKRNACVPETVCGGRLDRE